MAKCDYCGKENVEPAVHCVSCGTPLRVEQPPVIAPPPKSYDINQARGRSMMIRGAIVGGIGLVVTVGSRMAASGGGTYLVAWGAIVFGAIRFSYGVALFNGKQEKINPDDAAYAALSQATRLENQGRIGEALKAYQNVIDRFPNSEAKIDAQKSLEILKTNITAS